MRRFSLRSMLLLTALIAVVFAVPVRRTLLQKRGRQWVAEQRGHIVYRYSFGKGLHDYSDAPELAVPEFLVNLCGVDAFNPITCVVLDCDEVVDLTPLADLKSLESLAINIEIAEDLDFTPLAELPELQELHLTEWAFVSQKQLKTLHELLPDVQIRVE